VGGRVLGRVLIGAFGGLVVLRLAGKCLRWHRRRRRICMRLGSGGVDAWWVIGFGRYR